MKYIEKYFPQAQFAEHEGHQIPFQLTPTDQLNSPIKVCCPYPKGILKALGPDVKTFLQAMVTCDINKIKSNEGQRALFASQKGRILFDAIIYREDDQFLLITDPGEETKLLKHLQFYIIMDDVKFENVNEQYRFAYLLSEDKEFIDHDDWKTKVYQSQNEAVQGYLFSKDTDYLKSLSETDFQAIGFDLWDHLRPHFKIVRSGLDFSDQNLPNEIESLEECLSYTKGCFLGQEPIARVKHRGKPNKFLKVILSEKLLEAGKLIVAGEKEVGVVTSPSGIPTSQGYIALGYVRNSWLTNENPTPLEVEGEKIQVV
jgi:folate-binding protein YgfZ